MLHQPLRDHCVSGPQRARLFCRFSFFFFNDTATTEIYTLSLHDALPIWRLQGAAGRRACRPRAARAASPPRSEEHTSELQSRLHLVCRLLLEKKKTLNISTFEQKSHRVKWSDSLRTIASHDLIVRAH